MFVFRREDLPPDPVFPADLKQLGYFINEKDQIKKIAAPDQDFQFKINRNDRWNEVQRDAMNECIRRIVQSRLNGLGLAQLQLPLLATYEEPHVPILVSSNLCTASRIVVVFGEPVQDLGIWAYRTVGSDGINQGSAVAFAEAVLGHAAESQDEKVPKSTQESTATALLLANTGQLIWHCGSQRAMTQPTWQALPRGSAADPAMTMTRRNKIPGHANWEEHVEYIFDEVLSNRGRLVKDDARIDVIGVAEGAQAAMRYLARNWNAWRPYISAVCLANPLHTTNDIHALDMSSHADERSSHASASASSSFGDFVSSRCRAYLLSDEPTGVPVLGFREFGCNCYSSGEALNVECIMPKAWRSMLDWLNQLAADPQYAEPQLVIKQADEAGLEDLSGDIRGSDGEV